MENSESELKRIFFSFVAARSVGNNTEIAHGGSYVEADDNDSDAIKLVILDKLKELYPPDISWGNHSVVFIGTLANDIFTHTV